MLLSVFFILLSVVLFYSGTSLLVKGSSSLALKAGISARVSGLTVVALGTASPVLFVSMNAALFGHGNIAIANVIGSNIFNICIILGISAIIAPLRPKMNLLKIGIPVLTLVTFGFMLLFADRQISRFEGGILLAGMVLYTSLNIILAHREKSNEGIDEYNQSLTISKMKWYWQVGMIVLGIGFLVAGSEILIRGAVTIARLSGVGETIIGLTIIAAATGFPLLASSIVAARKKEYNIAIGNVIGSNILNILGFIGISSVLNPLSAIAISNIDLYIMLGVTLLLFPFFRTKYTMKRDDGIFMIGLYLIFVYYLWPK